MSSNETPQNRTVLTALAKKIHQGQSSLGATVGLHHHTAATMKTSIEKLTGDPAAAAGTSARKGSQLVYRDCVAAEADAESALGFLSDGAVKQWLEGYKRVIEGVHGKKANEDWVAAGFATGSTSVPRNHEARQTLLEAAGAYLSAHPDYESELPQKDAPALEITEAQATVLHGQMVSAFTLIANRKAEQAECKKPRDADVKGLYGEVSETIAELRDLLADDDARWESFGLNIPANPNPPEGVSALTLTPAGAGNVLAVWEYAVRAEYYRLFLQRMGTDAAPVNVADPRDLEHTLTGLTAGTQIKVHVVPMNGGGGGPASPVVTLTV